MNAGDLVVVRCWYKCLPYEHFGIDMGDGTVVELAGDEPGQPVAAGTPGTMRVRRSSRQDFARGGTIHPIASDPATTLPVSEVLQRAESQLGRQAYCLVSGNCEHFARWCKTGQWVSHQVNDAKQSLTRGLASAWMLVGSLARSKGLGSQAIVPQGVAAWATAQAAPAIPSLAGEVAEQLAKCAMARLDLSPPLLQRGSRAIGYGMAAAVGGFLGGPVGSARAIAVHAITRAAARGMLAEPDPR
jgi:hypothetical protein